MKKVKIVVSGVFLLWLLFWGTPSPVSANFIKTFLPKIAGAPFTDSDATAQYLSQYDLIITRKLESDNIGGSYGSTWAAIQRHNPNCKIHLYTKLNCTHPDSDSWPTVSLNNLGRYGVSRSHSDGRLQDHNGYFLHRNGSIWFHGTDGYLLDPGDANFQAYTLEAALTDHKDQPWAADGVFTDVLMSQLSALGWCDEYDTQDTWSSAVQSLLNYVTNGLHTQDQALSVNHGNTRHADVRDHWIALNGVANPPDYLLEEGSFVILWGPYNAWFYSENELRNQLDTMVALTNIGVLANAHADLSSMDSSGRDNLGDSFSGWDALYYALGAFCLGKDHSDAFFFSLGNDATHYTIWTWYFDEYAEIDLGETVGDYQITNYNGANIYWREFEYGYVFVNPTQTDVGSISLAQTCKQRTHSNLHADISTLPDINTINLKRHRAAFLYKKDFQTSEDPPIPPRNLRLKP